MGKKKPSKNNKNNVVKKKKVNKISVIIWSAVATAFVAVIAVAIVFSYTKNVKISQLCDYTWIPVSAHNASGDEVEMIEVYQTNYTSYQGSLTFSDDGTFSLWLSPGTPDDGTHSGKYELAEDNIINVTFDEGTSTSFDIERKDDKIESIIVYYDEYEICFNKQ